LKSKISTKRLAIRASACVLASAAVSCSPAASAPVDIGHRPKDMLQSTASCYRVRCVDGLAQLNIADLTSTPSTDKGVSFDVTQSGETSPERISFSDLVISDEPRPMAIPMHKDCTPRSYYVLITAYAQGRRLSLGIPYECVRK